MKNFQKHLLVKRVIVPCVVLVLFACLAILILTKPITQDEGVFLTIGKYINQGQLPYQDFFDHKPPAIYFLFAGLFKVFGMSVWVVKIALVLSILGTSVLLKKIGDIIKPETGWYATAIFLFLMTQFEGYFLIAEPFMLLPLLLSLWLLLRFEGQTRWMFLAGLAIGIAVLFKQTAVLSAIPLFILAGTLKKITPLFLAGFFFPLVILGSYLFANNIMAEAWHQVVTLTLTSYPREPLFFVFHALQHNFLYTLPVWILLLLGVTGPMSIKKTLWALVLVPLPFMFFRHYPHYWVQVLPFVALIVATALTRIHSRALTLAVLIFCVAIAGGKIGQDAIPNWKRLQEQLRVAQILSQEPAARVLAENQFTGLYFLLPQKPLNNFLYITEITDAVGAEQQTIDDIRDGQTILVLWPLDNNYAYAEKLQTFVLQNGQQEKVFPKLGMRVFLYRGISL